MPTAEIAGANIFHEIHGETGSPVVMIMGFGMRGGAWAHQIPDLSRHHRVLTLDNRGTGDTRAPLRPYPIATYADDVAALLDRAGWLTAHVVGVSMGGMIAQHVALRHRGRVRSLTLIATHPGGLGSAVPTRRGLSLFLRAQRGGAKARRQALERLLFPEEFLATCDRAWLDQTIERDFGNPPPRHQRWMQLGAVLRHDTAKRLHRLAGLPTLVVRPGQDLLVDPKHSDHIHRLIPGSRLMRFDDAGHGMIRQCPDRLNPALLEHFRDGDARMAQLGSGGLPGAGAPSVAV